MARFKYLSFITITPWEFFSPALADGFHWSLSDSKFPQVSRTLLSILADLSTAVVLMVFTCPPISDSSRTLTRHSGISTSAPITIDIDVIRLWLLLLLLFEFSHQRLLMVSHWNLSDSNPPRVSRTLLSILADSNNAVVRMVPYFILFPSLPVLVLTIWWLYQEHQLQLVSLALSCSSFFNSL